MTTNNSWNSENPAQVARGGTGASTLTGVLTGNGTSAITAATVTQYAVLLGDASNAVTNVSGVGTSGQVLTSNGAGMNPTWQTGGGDVSGPGSSTDNALARWDGTGGDTLQDSTVLVSDNGEMTNGSQPAFGANLGSQDANETGDGTAFYLGDTDVGTTLTEVFDQNSDFTPGASGGAYFTAPVSGRYYFNAVWTISGLTSSHTTANTRFYTSNKQFNCFGGDYGAIATGTSILYVTIEAYADMDAMDTCKTRMFVDNGTKVVDIDAGTYFSGFLVC